MSQDREEALQAAETAMALRMRDGLVDYKKGFAKRVSAYAAIFVVGAGFGAILFGGGPGREAPQDWAGEAAAYHAVDTTRGPSISAIPFKWLDASIDVLFPKLPWVFKETASLELNGLSTLRVEYLQDNGTPIIQYISRTEKADLSEPVVGLRQDVQSATWTKSGFDYLLIGGTDPSVIWNAAKELSAR
jgi:hypothetical protein